MSIIIYYNSVSSLREEIEQSNINKLEQIKTITDERSKELESLAARMSYDPRLTPYMTRNNYYSREAINELKKYKAMSSIIKDLFIYYHHTDTIYSSGGSYSLDTLTSKTYDFAHWRGSEILSDLHTEQPLIKVTNDNVRGNQIIAYIYPIPLNSSTPYGTVMYFIEEADITYLIQNILGDFYGNTYIFDEDGSVIVSHINDQSIAQQDLSQLFNGKDGVSTLEMDGKEYSLITVNSEISEWSFVATIEASQYFKRMIHLRTFLSLILLSVILIGSIFAIQLGRHQYKPIQGLFELMKKSEGKEASVVFDGRNELEVIHKRITDIFSNQESLNETMFLQKPLVKEQVLMKLLKGKITNHNEMNSLIKSVDMNLEEGYYFVAIIAFEGDLLTETEIKSREMIKTILSELKFQDAVTYGIDLFDQDKMALIVIMDKKVSSANDQRRKVISDVKKAIDNISPLKSVISVGSVYHDRRRINRSFIEALAAIEYKIVTTHGTIIYFEDIRLQQEQQFGYPIDDQLKIIQSIKQGDQDVAIETLTHMFKELTKEDLSIQVLKSICYDIINTILKTISEVGLGEHIQDYHSLIDFRSVEQLEEKLRKIIINICQEIEEKKESRNNTLRDKILDYVHTHYKTYDLTLGNIAQEFDLSISYLSRFFKEQIGETFTNYVYDLRLKEAKRQLTQTDKPIKSIVKNVGYNDASNFSSRFRKTVGITPGEYRKLNKEHLS